MLANRTEPLHAAHKAINLAQQLFDADADSKPPQAQSFNSGGTDPPQTPQFPRWRGLLQLDQRIAHAFQVLLSIFTPQPTQQTELIKTALLLQDTM